MTWWLWILVVFSLWRWLMLEARTARLMANQERVVTIVTRVATDTRVTRNVLHDAVNRQRPWRYLHHAFKPAKQGGTSCTDD